jgi:phage terminase large subunit-like protein
MNKRRSKPTISPVDFIDRVIRLDEKGEPFSLAPYQRRVLEMALRRDPSGELVFRLVVLSEPKKSGKTFVAALLALWWALTRHHTEVILIANDEEQATGRVFKTAVDLIEYNKALEGEWTTVSKLS